jgi:hypothetical protein
LLRIREEKDMSLQDRYSKIKSKNRKAKSKKAVSVIIGYVLLITFAVVLGVIVYKWMKTYVPQEDVNCPDGTSLYIESYHYDCTAKVLTLTIKNNGKFDVGGYFIRATDSPQEELAVIDLTQMNMNPGSKLNPLGIKFGDYVSKNSLAPNDVEEHLYNVSSMIRGIYKIEIVPVRWETQNRKMVLLSCKDAGIVQDIACN